MNGYARLPHVRNELNAQGTTAQDSDIVRAIERASAACRTATSRQFHTTTETRHFSGNGERLFYLGTDLLSITTIKVSETVAQPTTFENTLTVATDYTLWPRNSITSYRAITANPNGQYGAFPVGVDNIQIVGTWGYSEVLEAIAISGTPVTGTLSSTTDLTLTASVSVEGIIEIGDTLYIESEQLEVVDVATTTVTVTRAINGTTAAAHTTQALYLRRFPLDVERAVAADAARYLWRASQGYPEGSFREMWPAIHDTFASYVDPASVI